MPKGAFAFALFAPPPLLSGVTVDRYSQSIQASACALFLYSFCIEFWRKALGTKQTINSNENI